MILSIKPMPPLDLPCACGCNLVFAYPRRLRHIVRARWRYSLEEMRSGDQWGGIAIRAPHYFQPRHRRARRFWADHRVRRFGRRSQRKYLTRAPGKCYTALGR
jgi:hypothetical protein